MTDKKRHSFRWMMTRRLPKPSGMLCRASSRAEVLDSATVSVGHPSNRCLRGASLVTPVWHGRGRAAAGPRPCISPEPKSWTLEAGRECRGFGVSGKSRRALRTVSHAPSLWRLCHPVPDCLWPVPRARGPSGSRDNPSSPVLHSFKDMVSFTRVNPSVCEPVCRVSDEGEHGR